MNGVVLCLGITFIAAGAFALFELGSSSPDRSSASQRFPLSSILVRRLSMAGTAALFFGVVTQWPVAALAGGVMGFFATALLAPKGTRQAPIERTEAIAVWTEQLRDTMAAAAGLQQAIVATAPLAPEPIRHEVMRAASAAEREPLGSVLLQLADELSDPTADLVVSALVLAASGEAQDLGEVLSTVAASARDGAMMRRFVDASRARTRTAVRTITAIAIVTMVGLLVVGHGYLHPYSTMSGQLVLAVVLACYGSGVAILHRMGRERPVERILSPAFRRSQQ